MKLCLCTIVKNEAQTLPACLRSAQDVVDDMVVLDTGSSDRTPEVAQEYGARVYHFDWVNDFAAARNQSLRYATGDWILVLDADEVLVPEIVPILKQAIQQERHLVINLVRQEVGATQSPYSLVSRLFRHHPDIYFSRPYHAMVDDSVAQIIRSQPQWQVGYLPETAIRHYGYQQQAIAGRDKFAKARAAMTSFLAHHPDDPYVCSKLGALYVEIGEIAAGVELLERGLNSPAVNSQMLYELHYHLGIAYTRLANQEKAIAHYQAALRVNIYPMLKLGAYNNLGNLKRATGDLLQAKAAYEMAIQIDPKFAAGYYNLGMTLKAFGQMREAIASYQRAIQLNPDYAEAYQNLGVVRLKLGQVQESLAAFGKAIALYQQQNPAAAAQLRQGLQEMGFQV